MSWSVRCGQKRRQRRGSGKELITCTGSRSRRHSIRRATWERHQPGQEADDRTGEHVSLTFIGLSPEKVRQGKDSLGLASLNNFGGLWAMRVSCMCLVSGAGMIKVEEYCLLEYVDQIEEVWLS